MKRYKVEKLAVVRLSYYANAKSKDNAAKAMQKNIKNLEKMDIEYVLTLEEVGTYVEDITPKQRKSAKKKLK